MATATLDWSQCPAVESIPGKVSGAWVFRGTRMPVQAVFENLEAGKIATTVNAATPGTFAEVNIPFVKDAAKPTLQTHSLKDRRVSSDSGRFANEDGAVAPFSSFA